MIFAMKGYSKDVAHTSHSDKKLTISGTWYATGSQPFDNENGVPLWVKDLFDNTDIEMIAINFKNSGVVYSKVDSKVN